MYHFTRQYGFHVSLEISFVFNKNDIQIQITNEFLKHFFDLEHALKHLSCCLQ